MFEISLHILDILQNSIKAGASLITVSLTLDGNMLTVVIEDNGCGMSEEFVAKVCDPFVTTRTTRKVGMGISLFKAGAEGSGGSFSISSKQGEGTTVTAVFDVSCIDCPPLGDVTGTMVSQFVCHQEVDFNYIFTTGKGTMEFDTRQVKQVLGGVPLDTPEVMQWMLQSIKQELAEIQADKV